MKIRDGIKLGIGFYIGKELFGLYRIIRDDALACVIIKKCSMVGPTYRAAVDHVKENMPRTYAFYVEKGYIIE